jgi:two-component system, chemotaxis family, sensor kinase CheA
MSDAFTNEPMLDMFIFETLQLSEQLEQSILVSEKEKTFTTAAINEIFRIMHTIKGSAAMMRFQTISSLAHSMEDIFYFLREEDPKQLDFSLLSDLVLEGIDFIKVEIEKIKNKDQADGNAESLITTLKDFLVNLKEAHSSKPMIQEVEHSMEQQEYYISRENEKLLPGEFSYKAVIFFEEGCEMENIRAYTILHNLKDIASEIEFYPDNILDDDRSINVIRQQGFQIYIRTDFNYEKMNAFFQQTIFLKELELTCLSEEEQHLLRSSIHDHPEEETGLYQEKLQASISDKEAAAKESSSGTTQQSIISVSVTKLDKLMDLVGEMVIAEAMVIQNPDLQGLELDNFNKAARQLNKITGEIQDMVMAIRMVPLSATFQKMNRIVRDMSKKLHKEVSLEIIGENTEVDKNIIEHISDPLMHLVRNSMDHGLEATEDRVSNGKASSGTITLEAKNAGSDVLIIVKDDGKGLNKDKILQKARENGLIYKPEEDMTDKEIYNLILLPGFSTKDDVTEFSGRGVGMDVVSKNIETIGGSLLVESTMGKGTAIILKIPLTLAIIDGMNIKVGSSGYTIPTTSIKESFQPKEKDIITDPEGNEMIMVRGLCYPIVRLHELFHIETNVKQLTEGIIIMVEQDDKSICIFADELIGQQQVVVKSLPRYILDFKKIKGLAGCTLLGDGSISLILDISSLINM